MLEQLEQANKIISNKLNELGICILEENNAADGTLTLTVNSNDLVKSMETLKNDPSLDYDVLLFVSGTDLTDYIEVSYQLYSLKANTKVNVKVKLNREKPEVESITSLYKSADWHERETYDLLGVNFLNHPELKRLLLPEDWIGHPLRKDYVMQDARLTWNDR